MMPRNTSGMPWLIEIGSLHGSGNLLIRTDGGIKQLDELLEELGVSGGAPIVVE